MEEATKHLDKMHLSVAVNYGGRQEIVRAAQQIIQEAVAQPSPDCMSVSLCSQAAASGDLNELPPC